MVADLPARAIPTALELQCHMLEDDAEHHRLASPEDACSILCFRRFVQTAKTGEAMEQLQPFPADHIEFYKETIARLIQADELPQSAMGRFDSTFASQRLS